MTAPNVANPYDDLLDEEQRATEKAAQQAAFVASKRPDSARWARVLDLAQKTKLPADVVDRNFDEVSGAVATKESAYDRMLSDTPVVDQWMTNPDNATVGGPERDSLANVERLVKAAREAMSEAPGLATRQLLPAAGLIGKAFDAIDYHPLNLLKGAGSGLLSLESGIGHSLEATAETLGQLHESDNPLARAVGFATQSILPAAGAVGEALRHAEPVGRAIAENAASNQDALTPNVGSFRDIRSFGNLLDYGAYQVGQAAGSMAAIIAATATGGPAAGVITGGLENFGDIRGEIQDVAPEQSDLSRNMLAYALTIPVAALDAVTPGQIASKLATKGLGRTLIKEAAEHGLTRRVATALMKNALEEGGTEAAQEAIQYLGIRVGTGHEINVDELAPRMVDAFVGGALGGGVLGGATEIPGQRHAIRMQRFFQALGATTKDSKLVKDLPQAMQDVVTQMTKDGPVENAYMPVQDWTEYWQSQGSDPAREAEKVTGSREAYDQAVATGSDMVIPMGRYAVTIAPSEHNDALSEVVKFSPDALSVKELKALTEATQTAASETDATATGSEAQAAEAASTIHETLTERLQAAGMTPEVAATNAEVLAGLLTTQAASEGMTPEALLQRYGLEINRAESGTPVEGRALNQSDVTAAEPWQMTLAEFEAQRPIRAPAIKIGQDIYEGDPTAPHASILDDMDERDVEWAIAHEPEAFGFITREGEFVNRDRAYEMVQAGEWQAAQTRMAHAHREAVRQAVAEGRDVPAEVLAEYPDLERPSSPNILEQSPKGEGAPPRARIRIAGRSVAIDLLEKADLSSFIHETGHFAVHMMEDLAARPEASARLRNDLATLREWAGLKPGEAWTEDAHERVARGFEAFTMEGKAPSSGLRSAFARIRGWMLLVYQHLSALNVKLTPEVRGVFGRLLASEQEIQAAETEQGATPLFTDPAAIGMTPEEAERYSRAATLARETAENEMAEKVLADVRREQTARWKEERAKVRAEVAAAVNEEPASAAYAALTQGKLPDGSAIPEDAARVLMPDGKAPKLSKRALVEEYAGRYPELLSRLPRPYVYSREGGMHPDDAAPMFGFGSGDELIQALLSTDNPRRRIEALTDQRMRDEHGDIVLDGKLAEEAMKSIHGERRGELLALELAHLARKRPGAFRGLAKRAAEPIRMDSRNAALKAVRDEANRIVASKTDRQLNPRLYQIAEAKAARESVALFNKGDVEGAFQAKQRELLNHELYRAATAAREETEKIRDDMKRFDKLSTRQRIGKAGGSYLEQIDALRERYEFRRVSNTALNRRASLLSWVREQEAAGVEVNIPDELIVDAGQRNYRDVPLEELRGVRDAVKQIEHLAGAKNRLLAIARARNKEELVHDLLTTLEAKRTIRKREATAPDARTIPQSAKAWLKKKHGELTKVEMMMLALDGYEPGGAWWQTFIKPVAEAENAENDMRRADAEVMHDVMRPYSRLERARWFRDKIFIPEAKTYHGDGSLRFGGTLTKSGILSIALNWGNEYNRDALMEGHGWTTTQVETILSHLDARDWAWVKGVADHINSYWPEVEKLQREVTGLAPEKVEASPFRIRGRDGTVHELEGWYYPIAFDKDLSTRSAELDEKATVSEMFGNLGAMAMTRHGHVKARTDTGGRPLLLELSVVSRHLNQVIHDLAFRRAIIDLHNLTHTKEVQEAIEGTLGPEQFQQINPWMRGIAGDRPRSTSELAEGWARWARAGVTTVGLGLRVQSSVLQLLGYLNTIEELGPKYAARGFARAWGNPAAFMRRYREVTAKSQMMRDRLANYDRDVREAMSSGSLIRKRMPAHVEALLMKGDELTNYGSFWFSLIGMMDMAVSLPTWLGAYEKALHGELENIAPGDEQAARDYADSAVRLTQAAGATKDLAAIQRGGELQRTLTMFYSPMSTLYNQLARAGGRFRLDRNTPRLIASMTLLWFAVPLMEAALRQRGPDDDEGWWKWALKKEVFFPFQTIPVIRDLADAMEQKLDSGRNTYSLTPINRVGETIVDAAGAAARAVNPDEEVTSSQKRGIADLVGYVTHLPTGQTWKSMEYFDSWLSGDVEPSNPVQGLWQMLVTGKPKD